MGKTVKVPKSVAIGANRSRWNFFSAMGLRRIQEELDEEEELEEEEDDEESEDETFQDALAQRDLDRLDGIFR